MSDFAHSSLNQVESDGGLWSSRQTSDAWTEGGGSQLRMWNSKTLVLCDNRNVPAGLWVSLQKHNHAYIGGPKHWGAGFFFFLKEQNNF